MTAGLAVAQANANLNVYRNTASSAIATVFVQLHTGDPGAAGTANIATTNTRLQITWNAAASGSMTLLTLSSFTGAGTETITHVSLWTASSAGTFLQSAQLTSPVPIVTGSTLTYSAFTVAYSPIAA